MDNQTNDSMFWKFFVDAATVVAAAMLYFKTSEVMGAIAPLTLAGQTGLQVLYGLSVAALIEGICLAIHFIKGFKGNMAAQAYKWFLFAVSAFCQFMDRFFVVDTATTSANIEFFKFLTYGIPVAILGGLLLVARANDSQSVGKSTNKPFRGVRTMWREFMDGSGSRNVPARPETQVFAEDVPQEELEPAKLSYKKREER